MARLQDKLEAFWKSRSKQIVAMGAVLGKSCLVIFFAYLIASTLTTMSMGLFSSSAIGSRSTRAVEAPRLQIRNNTNHIEVRRVVVGRNLFNSDGELPDEEGPRDEVDTGGSFDPDAPCQSSSLPLELLGAILSGGGGDSVATVRERGFNVADVYRVGDPLLGNEQAVVFAIESRRLVLNNSGNKECIELKETAGVAAAPASTPARTQPDAEQPSASAGGSSSVSLDGNYVEDALGPGFAKILESGRLVPFNRDNNMIGFKLIGAKNDSLWQRIGLSSGDVITSVNGISMAQPDQGFAIFEALQNEREIRVEFLQKGADPSNVTVEIR